MSSPLPAHHTKHLAVLRDYPFADALFQLEQRDDGASNGTALWLGAQCLTAYLAHSKILKQRQRTSSRLKVVELGSGIGLAALALAKLGCDVLATDLPEVISSVLSRNIAANYAALEANIQIRALDWTVSLENWNWNDSRSITPGSNANTEAVGAHDPLHPPFDLIITADTLYTPALISPLLRALHALSALSVSASPTASSGPPVYVCIERRDSDLIDAALRDARDVWGFRVERVPHGKVAKALAKNGMSWAREDWEGVELYKMVLPAPAP